MFDDMLSIVRATQTLSTPCVAYGMYDAAMKDQQREWMTRLLQLAGQKGMKDVDVARKMNVTRATFSGWKDRGLPLAQLENAARSLETTIEYLKTGLDVARFHHQLTEEERQVLSAIKLLDMEDKKRLLQPLLTEADRIRRYIDAKK